MKHRNQKGLSSLSLLLVLSVAAFLLLLAFRIGPLYLDNYFVKAAIDGLSQEEDVHKLSDRQIERKLLGFFTINNVRDLGPEDIKVERLKTKTIVKVDYEKRVNILANVDAVVVFENHFDTSLVE
jgi:hypothetical protein